MYTKISFSSSRLTLSNFILSCQTNEVIVTIDDNDDIVASFLTQRGGA